MLGVGGMGEVWRAVLKRPECEEHHCDEVTRTLGLQPQDLQGLCGISNQPILIAAQVSLMEKVMLHSRILFSAVGATNTERRSGALFCALALASLCSSVVCTSQTVPGLCTFWRDVPVDQPWDGLAGASCTVSVGPGAKSHPRQGGPLLTTQGPHTQVIPLVGKGN